MLPKEYRLPSPRIKTVFASGKRITTGEFFLFYSPNNEATSQYTVVVGKTVSKKAVVRNRIKRCLRNALSDILTTSTKNFDVIIVVRKSPAKITTVKMKELLQPVFYRLEK